MFNKKTKSTLFRMSEEEELRWKTKAKLCGFSNFSEFIRVCINTYKEDEYKINPMIKKDL